MGHVRKLSSDVMRLLRAGPRGATAKLPRREFTKRVLAGAASGLALVVLGRPAAAFARISASGAALQIGCDDLENCTPGDSACDFSWWRSRALLVSGKYVTMDDLLRLPVQFRQRSLL